MSLKGILPWHMKIGVKLALSYMPFSYGVWKKLHLFEHGAMQDPNYVVDTFRSHYERASQQLDAPVQSILEIGPGDSIGTALVAASMGVKQTYLIDAGDYATTNMEVYNGLIQHLRAQGLVSLAPAATRAELLAAAGATYLTSGLESLRTIPDATVDLVISHAALEHVPRLEMQEFMRQTFRVLRPGGLASHQVDLKDHLQASLNSLRFGQRTWERPWTRKAGIYTNRLRHSEYLAMFAAQGFEVLTMDCTRWPSLPLAKDKLAREFRHFDDDDLRISGFRVLLRRPVHREH